MSVGAVSSRIQELQSQLALLTPLKGSTATASPASRCASLSPTQRMIASPAEIAASAFALTIASLSP